jgi:hypothetical protein
MGGEFFATESAGKKAPFIGKALQVNDKDSRQRGGSKEHRSV